MPPWLHPGQLAPAPLLAPGCNLRITRCSQAANYHLKGVTFFWSPLRDNEGAGLNNKVYIIMIITFITRKLGEIAPRPRPDCSSRGENWNETEEENVFVIVPPGAWVAARAANEPSQRLLYLRSSFMSTHLWVSVHTAVS